MLESEKVHEALRTSLKSISDLMDADYEEVHSELMRELGDNESASATYRYNIDLVIKVDIDKQTITVQTKSQWPKEKFGHNEKQGFKGLIDKPIENPLPGVTDDFGREPETEDEKKDN